MTTNEVNAILVELAAFKATALGKLDALAADNVRGEGVHVDHEARLRLLEANDNQQVGVWKLFTAGGALGAILVGGLAVVLRAFGV